MQFTCLFDTELKVRESDQYDQATGREHDYITSQTSRLIRRL
jgi:hypothetical protein